ncbi:MAG: hypothetical protein CMH57_15990 [Myxococcales bacterium]|nr:hypothetical protein [Myxococcales bacterium]
MRNIILTPCGIDFLTHGAESDMRERLKAAVNLREEEVAAEELASLSRFIEERLTRLNQATMDTARLMCAELEGIVSLYDGHAEERPADRHVLLPADAWLGGRVAQGLRDWLQWRGLEAEVLHIEDLHTRDIRSFRRSMARLARTCDTLFSETHAEGGEVIFNLTGGFRDIRGFLRVVGMFYADQTISGFQTSPELWSIPKLPVGLDEERLLGEHAELFERLCVAQTLPAEDCEPLPEALIMVEEGWATLSEWGTLASLLIQRAQRG